MVNNYTSQTETFSLRINFNLKHTANVGGKRSQIWLNTTIGGKRVRIYTHLLIKPQHWVKSETSQEGGGYAIESRELGRVVNKENKAINAKLTSILEYCKEYGRLVSNSHLQTSENASMSHTAKNFTEYIKGRIEGVDFNLRCNAERFIEDFIQRKAGSVNRTTGRVMSDGTMYNHKNAFARLRKYASEKHLNITWDLFTAEFEGFFTSWLSDKGFTPNTIASQYSVMKVCLKDAEEKKLIENGAFHHYPTKCHNVENIYLTEDEIKRLYELDLSDGEVNSQSKIEETRDLFVVGCWTGLRYSDYSHLPEIDANTDTVRVYTQKTNKTVIIPLHPMVRDIYAKYNGRLPRPIDKGKALKNIRHCARLAGINAPVSVRRVKGGRSVNCEGEKWKFIMNHTARRSFATNMYLKRVPSISIMSITGHTSEENFMKYIKVSQEEHARIVAESFTK